MSRKKVKARKSGKKGQSKIIKAIKKSYVLIPVVLFVLIVFGVFMRGSFLSVIGIADDYILLDDFSRGFVDSSVWGLDGSLNRIGVENDVMYYSKNYNVPNLVMIPLDAKPGMHFKTRLQSERINPRVSGSSVIYSSSATIYVNDVEAYKCIKTDNTGTKDCTVEGITSFEDEDLYVIRVDGNDLKTVNTSNPSGDGKIKVLMSWGAWNDRSYMDDWPVVKGGMDYFKYKIPYNCKINDDEILIFDSFAAGSTVNISTLTHEPVKFCLDYPIKARSFEENGIKTDIRGEILQKMVRGESTTVPENEEYKVFYITKLTSDIGLRCGIDEAYSTQTGICENPAEQIIVGCKTDADCYIPPGCTGVSSSCVENECAFQGSCIFKPESGSMSLWDKIMELSFMQWIASIFK